MKEKRRRLVLVILVALLAPVYILQQNPQPSPSPGASTTEKVPTGSTMALHALEKLEVKGRAPKTDYSRAKFLSDWGKIGDCDMRNIILKRDMTNVFVDPFDNCTVHNGTLDDPYTGKVLQFKRGQGTSQLVQIDHVVALSDAWQKGGQQLSELERSLFGNDPLNLLAVDGPANQNKSDGDAATWLPPNKAYRCRYVARQIAVKLKYHLWVTLAEKEAIKRQLGLCPGQVLPIESVGS